MAPRLQPKGARGVVVWLRQDLRLHDHPALSAAAAAAKRAGGSLTLVYVHSPEEDGDEPLTGAAWVGLRDQSGLQASQIAVALAGVPRVQRCGA